MQPKSAIFISAALTAFVLATLVGVVNALKNVPATAGITPTAAVTSAPAQAASTSTSTTEPTAAATQPGVFGPMEAVSAASQFLNQQDVYSVESSTYNQVPAYKVTFSSGDVVYIGLDGQVLANTKLQPVVVNVAPTKPPKKNKNSDNNSSSQAPNSSGGGEHEDEHEGDHD